MKEFFLTQATFAAAHFYHQPAWTEERNRAEFGRCFTPEGHGHNYRVEVEFEWSSALPESARDEHRAAVRDEADRLDHAHLNFNIPEFQTLIPTSENIARVLLERLRARNLPAPVRSLSVFETDDLWVEVRP